MNTEILLLKYQIVKIMYLHLKIMYMFSLLYSSSFSTLWSLLDSSFCYLPKVVLWHLLIFLTF